MKILQTAILLIFTLLVVPIFTYLFGIPLGVREWEALWILIKICGVSVVYCFLVGEITNNNSQVDKYWSILPIIYAWVMAYFGDISPRMVLLALIVSTWGIRLTFNFARKGAYRWKFWEGEEDYRWEILRKKSEFQPKWKWTLFNLFFISGYQNVLILLFTLPMLVAMQFDDGSLGLPDYLVAGMALFFLALETIADEQQWKYQREKWRLIREGKLLYGDFAKGFLDKGLWAISRHPNYLGEQGFWVSFYLFSVAASGQWLNWSVAGCLLLLVLFQGSSNFSEEISASKYAEYKNALQKNDKGLYDTIRDALMWKPEDWTKK
jgi:steroid 5-alpha reductase family enzyme